MNTAEKFDENIMHTYGRYPLVMESGDGEIATDENGKRFIDFGSGIGVNSLGYCNEEWTEAVCAQAKKLQHASNYYYTKVQADFAARLNKITGYRSVFFANSGAEANECAIKTARKYSFDKYGRGRCNIITLKNSFHGRTLCTLSATGQDEFHKYFFPFVEGFVNVEPNNIADLKEKLDESVCAVMFEYIQGEGGVCPLDRDFVDAIFELCGEKDILTIADEVQTGVGRTGKFLAGEHYGHKADITTLAKGIAGGIPMGACLAAEKCADVLTKGTHGSTFGGNPIACAGGNAVLNFLERENSLEEIAEKGAFLKAKLLEIPEIAAVDGKGLMLGALPKTGSASEIAKKAFENGLLVLTAKEKLRFLPPLTISKEEIEKGVNILAESFG